MNEHAPAPSYKRHRFPPAIIGHAVRLYFRFALSYRDVEELLAERGVIVNYEMIRPWCRKFGQAYANELRRRRPRPGDTWHLDAHGNAPSVTSARIIARVAISIFKPLCCSGLASRSATSAAAR